MKKEEFIQQLIETKSFEGLSHQEKEIVLSIISKDEYRSRGEVVELSKKMLDKGVDSMTPSPLIKHSVAEFMEQQKLKNQQTFLGTISRILQVRIPAYQFVVTLALIIFFLPPLFKNDIEVVEGEPRIVKEVAYLTDTIVIEKEIPKLIEVEKVKYIEIKKDAKSPTPDGMETLEFFEKQAVSQNENPDDLTIAKEQFEQQLRNIGQSSIDREELIQFIGR